MQTKYKILNKEIYVIYKKTISKNQLFYCILEAQ